MENFPQVKAEKRFAPSKEEFSQKRLEALKKTVDSMRREHPEVLSFSMFGSMARGNAHKGSDIDGYLFVDVTEREKQSSHDGTEASLFLKDTSNDSGAETSFLPNAAATYREIFSKLMSESSEMNPQQIEEGLKVKPVSPRIVTEHLNSLVENVATERAYHEANKAWEASAPADTTDLTVLLEHRRAEPERPRGLKLLPSSVLLGMFHLDVGGGIRPYREQVVRELQKHGPDGEAVWSKIIEWTERMENHGNKTEKRYPRTLAEAEKVYGARQPS